MCAVTPFGATAHLCVPRIGGNLLLAEVSDRVLQGSPPAMSVLDVREESHHHTSAVPRAGSSVSVVVDEAPVDKLNGSDGTAAISFTEEDRSLRYAKETRDGPRDRRGSKIGPAMQSTVTLIQHDPKKIAEGMHRREDIPAEVREVLMKSKPVWKVEDQEWRGRERESRNAKRFLARRRAAR